MTFVDNTRIYFNKVFELCQKGMSREKAYDEVENEYFLDLGKHKYDSFESFQNSWYRYWRQRNNRN